MVIPVSPEHIKYPAMHWAQAWTPVAIARFFDLFIMRPYHEAAQEDTLHPGILLNYMASRPIVAVLSIIPHLPAVPIPVHGWLPSAGTAIFDDPAPPADDAVVAEVVQAQATAIGRRWLDEQFATLIAAHGSASATCPVIIGTVVHNPATVWRRGLLTAGEAHRARTWPTMQPTIPRLFRPITPPEARALDAWDEWDIAVFEASHGLLRAAQAVVIDRPARAVIDGWLAASATWLRCQFLAWHHTWVEKGSSAKLYRQMVCAAPRVTSVPRAAPPAVRPALPETIVRAALAQSKPLCPCGAPRSDQYPTCRRCVPPPPVKRRRAGA